MIWRLICQRNLTWTIVVDTYVVNFFNFFYLQELFRHKVSKLTLLSLNFLTTMIELLLNDFFRVFFSVFDISTSLHHAKVVKLNADVFTILVNNKHTIWESIKYTFLSLKVCFFVFEIWPLHECVFALFCKEKAENEPDWTQPNGSNYALICVGITIKISISYGWSPKQMAQTDTT